MVFRHYRLRKNSSTLTNHYEPKKMTLQTHPTKQHKHQQSGHNALQHSVPSIPSHWYYDSEHFAKELALIFQRQWLYVCSEQSLAEPLQYRCISIGKQNIVIVRNRQNQLKAFYNTCRHRGSILCVEQQGKLQSNQLSCPYHQWSYSLQDGSLRGTTSFTLPEGFDKRQYGLYPVALQLWRGLIFINLDAHAKWQGQEVFQDYAAITDRYPLEKMVLAESWQKVVQCNWKVYWENFSECLHCPNIHPELSELVPLYSRRLVDIKDVPDWQNRQHSPDKKYSGGLKSGAETWSADGSAQNHGMRGIVDAYDFNGQAYSTTWPSMFMGAYADHIRIVRLLPIDPEQVQLTAEWLFEQDALDDAHYDLTNVTDFAKLVMQQDADACEMNQKGLHNQVHQRGVLMPEEYTIKHFYDWLLHALNETFAQKR